MNSNKATIIATRLVGVCALGWVYMGVTGLGWALHMHRVHMLIRAYTLSFNYGAYLALNLAYLGAAIGASGVLILLPGRLLGALTPVTGRRPALSLFWTSAGVVGGIAICLLGVHSSLATAMWTVYRSGNDAGWQMDIGGSCAVAIGGFILARKMLAPGREAGPVG